MSVIRADLNNYSMYQWYRLCCYRWKYVKMMMAECGFSDTISMSVNIRHGSMSENTLMSIGYEAIPHTCCISTE